MRKRGANIMNDKKYCVYVHIFPKKYKDKGLKAYK